MFDYDFNQGDPGDTPNGAWVRARMREQGLKIDRVKLIKKLPMELVGMMFDHVMQHEFPNGL